jgi:hypothetical protein
MLCYYNLSCSAVCGVEVNWKLLVIGLCVSWPGSLVSLVWPLVGEHTLKACVNITECRIGVNVHPAVLLFDELP